MPQPILVKFTPLELWACSQLAEQIRKNKTEKTSDETWDGKGYFDRNLKGIKGAYAVAKLLGVDFDRDLYEGQDCGWDLQYKGFSIEVKHLQKYLAFNRLNHFKCQIAILVNPTIENDSVNVMGWISKKEFEAKHFIANFGYGDRVCIKSEDLNDLSRILSY